MLSRLLLPAVLYFAVSSAVTSLTQSRLFPFIQSHNGTIVVMFHVNWCHSCKRTLPEFLAAAEMESSDSVVYCDFDCTDSDFCRDELEITAYPALRVLDRTGTADPMVVPALSEWHAIPYYERDARGIFHYVKRVSSEGVIEVGVNGPLSQMIESPVHGLRMSVVAYGFAGKDELVQLLGRKFLNKLKVRFQMLLVTPDGVTDAADGRRIEVVPQSRNVLGSKFSSNRLDLPIESEITANHMYEWIRSHEFSSYVWRLSDPAVFQYFTDQPKYKVLLVVDEGEWTNPLVDQFQKEASQCSHESFTFGILAKSPGFSDALAEFGNPKILVLYNEVHDFTRYSDKVRLGAVCAGLDSILDGRFAVQYRGGVLARWNYKFASFMSNWFGIESESGRLAAAMGALGLLVVLLLKLASLALGDGLERLDPPEPAIARQKLD